MIVQITQLTPNPPLQYDTADLHLRGWYSQSFIAGDGVTEVEGGNGQTGFYYDWLCTQDGDGNLVIPALDVQATTESNPTASFKAQLYVDGAPNQMIIPSSPQGSGWAIPTTSGPVITFAELALYNRAKRLLYPPSTYWTADQVIAAILEYAGNFDYMAVGINGIGSIDTAPAVASLPIVLGTNSLRIQKLNSVGNLIWTGEIIIGADSDASGTDTVQIQTRATTRLRINNDGTFQSMGNAAWEIGESGASSSTTGPAMKLATGAAAARYNWRTRTIAFTNGPIGEPNYDDHTMLFGFNFANNGTREVSGLPTIGISLEHRFYSGSAFQSEFITTWLSPDGTISRRPYQWNARHTDGLVTHNWVGDFIWLNSASTEQWLTLDESTHALLIGSSGVDIKIRKNTNNVAAISQLNAAGNAYIDLIRLDASNIVQVGLGAANVGISGTLTAATVSAGLFNFSTDTNTDIFNVADGYIQLRSNGTGKFYIAPDGIHAQDSIVFDNATDDIGISSGASGPRDIFALRTIDAVTSFQVNGTKVVGARETGWTAATGTPNKGAFAAYAGATMSAGYVQAEAQATNDAAKAASQRIKAIEDALRTHGLIN